MRGLIGTMTAVSGQRDALIAILLDGINDMPGCLSDIAARDPTDADAVWITGVWDSVEHHKASLSLSLSLSLPQVQLQAAIAKARPIIAGFDTHVVTEPMDGHGLPA
jgi:quinol monooxygenase YgiN